MPTEDSAEYREARRHVRKLRDFVALLLTAFAVIALTATINLVRSPDRLWFLWVVFAFAIAIVFSAIDVFGRRLWLGPEWEQRQVERRLHRMRGRAQARRAASSAQSRSSNRTGEVR